MKLKITNVSSQHHERQQRFRWTIDGDIAGRPVTIRYLDSGNNAQYDTQTVLDVDAANEKDKEAIEEWFDEAMLSDLEAGKTFSLTPEPPSAGRKSPRGKSGPGGRRWMSLPFFVAVLFLLLSSGVVFACISPPMTDEEKKPFFTPIDTDADGFITIEEFNGYMTAHPGEYVRPAAEIISVTDKDKDGKLSIAEFRPKIGHKDQTKGMTRCGG